MLSTVRSNNLCLNCLKPGHISKNCGSNNRCRRCQRPNHTLLHNDAKNPKEQPPQQTPPAEESQSVSSTLAVVPPIANSAHSGTTGNTLLMTCQVFIHAPDGSHIQAQGLLDSGSSASFVSERLAQSLSLKRSTQNVRISGIAGISHGSPLHSIATFTISPTFSTQEKIQISAIIVPRVTCDLPVQPVHFNSQWSHLSGLHLADPDFGQPNKIDILLGVDIYADVILQGWRSGPPGTPVAFETKFGWMLAGKTEKLSSPQSKVASHHVSVDSGDDILRRFWEIEENPRSQADLSPQEQTVVRHFNENHT